MSEKDIKNFTLDLMRRTQPAFLSTIDEEGKPQIRAIENFRNPEKFPHQSKLFNDSNDDLLVYISTNTSSEKVKQININPEIALYYCIPEEYRAVMIRGQAEIETDQEIKEKMWEESMRIYYSKGAEDSDFTLIKLIPNYIKTFYRLKVNMIDLRNKI